MSNSKWQNKLYRRFYKLFSESSSLVHLPSCPVPCALLLRLAMGTCELSENYLPNLTVQLFLLLRSKIPKKKRDWNRHCSPQLLVLDEVRRIIHGSVGRFHRQAAREEVERERFSITVLEASTRTLTLFTNTSTYYLPWNRITPIMRLPPALWVNDVWPLMVTKSPKSNLWGPTFWSV